MDIIKINGQYINFDNVRSVTFQVVTVFRKSPDDKWFTSSTPDNFSTYEQRPTLMAVVNYVTPEDYSRVIDAEPLRDYLNKAAMDLDVDTRE